MSKENVKQFLKRLETVPLYKHENIVFQLLKNRPQKFILTSKTVRDRKPKYQIFFNKSMISTEGSRALFSLPRLGRPTTLSDDLII